MSSEKTDMKENKIKSIAIKNEDIKNYVEVDIKTNEMFWNATVDELKNGYIKEGDTIRCLICGKVFQLGKIYRIDEEFYEPWKAAQIHIQDTHNSMLKYLLGMNGSLTGVSEVQRELLKLLAQGISDKEIANRLGVATSTIRNHRYKLREKEKQSKLYLVMMELLAENTNKKITKLDKDVICDSHKTATTLDDRFNTTNREKRQVIKNYINENGSLKSYPSKEKKKIIVLEQLARSFTIGKIYSEKEINIVLSRVYEDYVTIRRALIEYGFLSRSNDCKNYWVKE
jgi:Trp operon repressor